MNYSDKKKNCDKIREIYITNGLTYEKMSEITGIKHNTIACWCTGRRNPPDHTVEYVRAKVADYFNKYNKSVNEENNEEIETEAEDSTNE